MRDLNVSGLIIWTEASHFASMRSFYSDILELPIRSDRKEFINFEINSFRLTITVHSEIKNFAKDPLRIMINLGTPQIQQTYKMLTAKGVAFQREPEQEKWGGWIATFRDPDGNVIQLLEEADPSKD